MGALDDWVQGRRDRLTWLDVDRYVWAVFAGSPARWYADPAILAATAGQAQGVVRSDVYPVRLAGPFSEALAAADTAEAVAAALGNEEPRQQLAETIDALHHRLGDAVDIVLDCPSPRTLLGAGADVSFDDLDDVAAALLEVIRLVADRPVRGLQVRCTSPTGPDADEAESWDSLLAAAGYYDWVRAIRLDEVTDPADVEHDLVGEVLLFPDAPADRLAGDRRHGGGLTAAVWAGTDEAPVLLEGAAALSLRCGEVPADAEPEIVLARLSKLADG